MKKIQNLGLLFLTLAFLVVTSCKVTYNNKIQSSYLSQSPVRYDTTRIVNNHPTPVYDTLYVVSPTWSQALKKSNKVLFYGGASGAIISIPWAATLFNPTSMFPVTLTCVVVSAGSVEWEKWNFDKEITKNNTILWSKLTEI